MPMGDPAGPSCSHPLLSLLQTGRTVANLLCLQTCLASLVAFQASGWAQRDLIRWDCCPLGLKPSRLWLEPIL